MFRAFVTLRKLGFFTVPVVTGLVFFKTPAHKEDNDGLVKFQSYVQRAGNCFGNTLFQVTQVDSEEEKNAATLQKIYKEARNITKQSNLVIFPVIFAHQYQISEKDIKTSNTEFSLGGALKFMLEESDSFNEQKTFFILINAYDKNGTPANADHIVRLDSLGFGQCTYYDANVGLAEGKCSNIQTVYNDLIQRLYRSDNLKVFSLPLVGQLDEPQSSARYTRS